ncbi:unnamed protein product [Closterium sp. NIES-54]
MSESQPLDHWDKRAWPSAPTSTLPTPTAATATTATAAPAYCATMASLRVLAFDHEGRPVQFDTWLDDLQLYLLSDIKYSVSLFDQVSGAAIAPPATTDSLTVAFSRRCCPLSHSQPSADRQMRSLRTAQDRTGTADGGGGGSGGSGGGSSGGDGGGGTGGGSGGSGGGDGVAAVAAVGQVAVGLALGVLVLEVASVSSSSVAARPSRPSSFTCGQLHTPHHCFSRLDVAWCAEFGDDAELPCWADLLRSRIAIFDLDFDAIPSSMYALSVSASESGTLPGTAPAEALHTFTRDLGAPACFFRDSTTLTPLSAPIPVRLADPSGGPVVARSSTVLPCPAVPSGSLSGLHLPSFSTKLVRTAALEDAMVTTTTPGGQRVSICTCTRTGRHLATFTRRPGSILYTLATKHPHVAASAQVSASGRVAASCSCRLLSHQTLLWHHRLGHPSLPRLHGMHSRLLVSGLPRSLPPFPPLPAPPCLPCVEGWQRAAPHSSSFPPTTAPLQTLHVDVWGPARVSGQGRERYLLLVVDDYTRYTTVFPLRSKGEVSAVLIPWICRVRLQLRERFGQDLPVLRLHFDRGVMEVARTSMIHAAAPHFLWPFAVRYAEHQLNLWPRVSLPETSPTLRWTGKVGDASVFRVAVGLGAAPGAGSGGAVSGGSEQGGAESEGAGSGGDEPRDEEPGRAEPAGVETRGVEPRGADSEGAESGDAEPRGAASSGGLAGASPGATGAGGARDARAGGAGVTAAACGTGGTTATGAGGARTRGTGATGTGGVGGAGAGDPTEPGAAGARGTGAGGAGAGGAGAAGAGAVDPGAGGARDTSQLPLQPASQLPAPSPYTEQFGGLTERREPTSRPVSPIRTARRVPPRVPGTHAMALRPSSVPLRVPLPPPPESSLLEVPDPQSDRARAASPTVARLLATAVSDPSFETAAASALVAELLDFAAACRLDYATALNAEFASASPSSVGGECALGTDVLEDGQEDFECLAARFSSMLVAPEGDPDAPDIPTSGSYAEAITSPYSSQWQAAMDAEMASWKSTGTQWQAAMDAEMASWKSTGTYVDEVPSLGANIVNGMWIFRVKRPPGSPPAFKTFSPTSKKTTLRMLLHVAAQRDYELHSPDFSTAFLPGSLHEEIWLRRPSGFIESFPAVTPWSLRRPVYGLRQAPREWHDTLRTTLAALGFAPATADLSLFLRTDTSLPPFYVLVYVDDLVFATAYIEAMTLVKSELQKRHTCTDVGELRSYLGLQITQDRARRTITLTQSHMVHQVHWDAAKRVLRYLCNTSGMGLVLGGRSPVVLTGHVDTSWVDDSATQRSSHGYTFGLGSGSVSWRSSRSSSVLSSNCEAKIYAGAMAAQELRWLTYLLTDLGEQPRLPPVPSSPSSSYATAASAASAALAAIATMASLTVLTFDAEGRAVDFDVWVDDLQLFLQCDSRDGVSLFNHTSGVSNAPSATADSAVRSQWTTRDAVARLATLARYSSPATAALSRLMLLYLFPHLAAFATVADLITHLRTSDGRYCAALPTESGLRLLLVGGAATARARGTRVVDGMAGAAAEAVEETEGVAEVVGMVPGVGALVVVVEVVEAAAEVEEAAVAVAVAAVVEVVVAVVMVEVQPRSMEALVVAGAISNRVPVRPRRPSSFVSGTLGVGGPGLPRWGDLLKQNVAIFDIDFHAILAAMYALTNSAEGYCYLSVPPDPGIEIAALGASESAAPGTGESTAPGAGESALSGTAPIEALHTFTLDSGASRSFFRDSTTLTPLCRPVAVSLADPSGVPVLAHSSTVLPCLAAPSGLLLGLHLPSFSTNLVSGADLQDAWVDQFAPGGQRVTHCTCSRTGRHLATFTRRPGSSLYTLTTAPPPVSASGQVAASSEVFAAASRSSPASAPCSCRPLSHESLLWHHRLGHPSLPRLQGMASRTLVSGLPRSLPPLPPGPVPTSVPCVEGRQRAAPHSFTFPPTEAPLQTLHMDVWGPARVRGQGHERYFLLVVDDYSRYTTVFPLRSKGEVPEVLIDWIRGARRQLRERFGLDLSVLRLHLDRGGEFSSDLLRAFCRAEGIHQTFTLPASPQQNGIAERRIGMVMDDARTSMIHAAAPHFLWPFAVQYAAHQINLQPCVSLPETTPTLRWTGKVGDASALCNCGSRAFVRNTSADKLSSCDVPCVFLGFPPDAPGWQFYHPSSRRVLSSQDVTFDESGPAPSGVSQVDPSESVEVAVDSSAARGAEPERVESGGAEPECVEPGGAESERVEPGGAESGGAEPACAESGGSPGVPLRREPLSPLRLCEWYARRCRRAAGAGGAAGAAEGAAGAAGGAGGAGAGGSAAGSGAAGCAAGAGAAGGAAGAGATGGASGAVGGTVGVGDAGHGGARPGGRAAGAGGTAGVGAVGTGASGAAGVVAGDPRAEGTGSLFSPPLLSPPPVQSQSQFLPFSPLPSPFPYSGLIIGLAERYEPESHPVSPVSRSASPVRTGRAGRCVSRPRPPPVPGTHSMTLRPSTAPQRVPLPSPLASSLPDGSDPESDSHCAASPTVTRFLAIAVTDPLFQSTAAPALVSELVDFAATYRLDYATSLVAESASASVCPPSVGGECALGTDFLEDRQEEFECFAAAVPHLVAMVLAPEGDPDAPDIPTPRSYAEAIEGPYSSQWQAAMDAEMASWKSAPLPTGYLLSAPPSDESVEHVARMGLVLGGRLEFISGFSDVNEVPLPGANIGVDFFQTFSPTPKMTTLRVLLHVAAQRDYELHSLDLSTAFLQGSLHEEIWLRRSPGFTGSFPAGTQWSLRRPVYGLRQAPPEWHDTLRTTLAALGFAPSTADPLLFLRTDTTLPPFYVLVYVDNLVFATADTEALAHVKSELQKRHTCTDLDPPSDESVEPSGPYPELVGCLMYLMTCTRPDLAYPLSLLARYVAPGRHRKVHWDAAKRVLHYLCSTSGMGLVLGGRARVVLTGHADASWELRWLTYLLTDLGEAPRSPPVVYVDNKAILALCQEHRLEHRTKHIALCYFLAQELQQRGQLCLAYVTSQASTADVFTKALQPSFMWDDSALGGDDDVAADKQNSGDDDSDAGAEEDVFPDRGATAKDNDGVESWWPNAPREKMPIPTSGYEKERVTVMLACMATGKKLKPWVFFKHKTLPKGDILNDVVVGYQANGWMEATGVIQWLDEGVVPFLKPKFGVQSRSAMLVLDSYRGHLTKEVKARYAVLNIVPAVIPAGCTADVQPLDCR